MSLLNWEKKTRGFLSLAGIYIFIDKFEITLLQQSTSKEHNF